MKVKNRFAISVNKTTSGNRIMKNQLSVMTKAHLAVFALLIISLFSRHWEAMALSSSSSFLGQVSLSPGIPSRSTTINVRSDDAKWSMRKQKANDKRTRRLQQHGNTVAVEPPLTLTKSPISGASWSHKTITEQQRHHNGKKVLSGGRNRSRKRSNYYSSVFSYHNHFLRLLKSEYKAEVSRN